MDIYMLINLIILGTCICLVLISLSFRLKISDNHFPVDSNISKKREIPKRIRPDIKA